MGMKACIIVIMKDRWKIEVGVVGETGARDEVTSATGIDARDFGALQAQSRHQAALVKEECIRSAVDGGGGQTAGQTTIDDDKARAAAYFPTTGTVDVADGGVIHQEKRVAEFLDASLQAPGSGGGLIEPGSTTVAAEHRSITCLAAEQESGPGDGWEDEHGSCICAQCPGGRVLCIK